MRVLDAESTRRAGAGLAIWRQLCCEALSVPPISFPDPLGLEACPPACFGEQAALVEVQRPRPSLVPDRPRAGPPHRQGLYAISISSAPVGLRHRQSHGGLFRQLGTSNPYTAIAFEGYSRFTPTACALLQWIARRGRTVMEDAADRRSPDSILPREFLNGLGAWLQPEKRLMLAVLEGAVSDFQKYATASSGRGRRLFADADAWFGSTNTDDPLSFVNICYALALDHRSSEPASAAGAARATGTASIEDGPSLSLSPGERDTAHDLRAVLIGRTANPARYAMHALEMVYRSGSRHEKASGERSPRVHCQREAR